MWLLALFACAPEAPPPEPVAARPPDIMLITIDTLRADRVGCYGDPLAQTPNLDHLAAQGALFREAHAVVPLTLPSHTSILTGLLPKRHGMRDNSGFRLADSVTTLAEKLRLADYQTGAFVSAFVLDAAWGLDQGFDVYRAPFHPQDLARTGAFGELELPGAEVANAAAAWWRAAVEPRFAWVHLYDPHTPWAIHPNGPDDPYRGEVSFADALVGRLVQAAGSEALIIVTSDHGEGLWDHGEREHGVLLDRSATRVPLIVRPPEPLKPTGGPPVAPRPGIDASERPKGVDPLLDLKPVPDAPVAARVVEALASGVDVAPTILDYAGVALAPGEMDGRSLRDAVEGKTVDAGIVYSETFFPKFHYGWSGLIMAQDASRRLERGVWSLVYDWQQDPGGVAGKRSEDLADPLLRLALESRGDADPQPALVDDATAAALEALGYLTAPVIAGPDAPDPRERVGLLGELAAAEALDGDESIAALQALVKRQPDMVDARLSLGNALSAKGELKAALAQDEEVLARWPEHPTALNNAGLLARQTGDRDRALLYARRLQALNPRDARGFRLEVAVHVDREEPAEVIRVGNQGLLLAPEDPNLHYLVGLAEVQDGDAERAVEHFNAAEKNGARAKDLPLWKAYALDRAGRLDEARIWYDQAARSLPEDPRPMALAGVMLARAGRCEDARGYLINVARRGGGRDPRVREAMAQCLGDRGPGGGR